MRYLLALVLSIIFYSNGFAQNNSPKISWEFTSVEDDMGIPRTTIYVVVNEKKTLLVKGMGVFHELEKDSFRQSQYQIPKNAISACAGFWAGLGHQICVVPKGKVLEIKEGFLEAESPKGTKVRYKTIKTITLE
ncbi:hypothetical protein AD998_03965 [bacterium 336/3]|jgi:hypothetical protein|nr:hypothetical protein AD998_03965 [bacterium 336/3]